jgi:hypothetical protein
MYNDMYRPKFNKELFNRSDDDLINALRNVIYSCERESSFTIRVMNFEVIEDCDDVNHILWEYEDGILNKGKKVDEAKKKAKFKDNQYNFINLKDSDLKIIKVDYYIQIMEKKNGLVEDNVTSYIAIPRIVDGFYFRINGNMYSAMYQIVDASTYNNSAAKNAKKQSITFKTIFMPIRVYRYTGILKDQNGLAIPCTYFVANMFKKSLLLMKYIMAKKGYYGGMSFLGIKGVYISKSFMEYNPDEYYIFPVKEAYIMASKLMYDSVQVVQSFVYTLYTVYNQTKDIYYTDLFSESEWIKSLGSEFTTKDFDTINEKGTSILGSLEFIYDRLSKEDLKLRLEDKDDIYRVLRWMMYEFNALRQKDNLDISTKKVRWAEYIASYYAAKLATGIYRISDKGDKADLSTIKKAIVIPPMYLVNAINKCQLVNYKDCVNDLDAITALKYSYKGVSGIGEKANAISNAYRSVHPSHLGRVDIDSSSNSDPGISGTICPLAKLYDKHFIEYEEPSTWESELAKVVDIYRSMNAKKEMCTIIGDIRGEEKDTSILNDCLQVAKKLVDFQLFAYGNEEYINGFDIFGDGLMYYERFDDNYIEGGY